MVYRVTGCETEQESFTLGQGINTKTVRSLKFFQSDNVMASFSTTGERDRDSFGTTGTHAIEAKL